MLTTGETTMMRLSERSRVRRSRAVPAAVALVVSVAILAILVSAESSRGITSVGTRALTPTTPTGSTSSPAVSRGQSLQARSDAEPSRSRPQTPNAAAAVTHASSGTGLPLPRALGQLIVSGFAGTSPPASILAGIRGGQLGGVILMGANTTGGLAQVQALTGELQAAARAGGNPGLLIMTDQEGGEVKRLPGPPEYAASEMGSSAIASAQGAATARLLRKAGVNVDLAPVADVARVDGFMAQEQRTFGRTPNAVSAAACAFADQLRAGGVAYTLKHFPGLGSAITSTDDEPVDVQEPRNLILADDLPYGVCGKGRLALVMVSSASYANLTGSTPAVMSPYIYRTLMPRLGIDAVTISDDFDSPAIVTQQAPAETSINAGLDLVLYAGSESSASSAYGRLLEDAQQGSLSSAKVMAAAHKVLSLKHALGLPIPK